MIKTNYHTHTDFCDGQASPEVMVQEAIKRNFAILGFSGHCCYPFAEDWHIQVSRLGEYMQEIRRLQETYKDSIEILLGFEADYLPPVTRPSHPWYKSQGLDYTIGSLHYVITPQGISTIDGPVEEVVKADEPVNEEAKEAVAEEAKEEAEKPAAKKKAAAKKPAASKAKKTVKAKAKAEAEAEEKAEAKEEAPAEEAK